MDFASGKEGLLMAPAYAVPAMLQDAGLTLQDFDYYEIHEAFAAQVLCTLKAWESPEYCRDVLGLSAPLGSIDRKRAEREGRKYCGRASVRGDRHAYRRLARQDSGGRSRREARPDFRVHRRRHGRDRHRGTLSRALSLPSDERAINCDDGRGTSPKRR